MKVEMEVTREIVDVYSLELTQELLDAITKEMRYNKYIGEDEVITEQDIIDVIKHNPNESMDRTIEHDGIKCWCLRYEVKESLEEFLWETEDSVENVYSEVVERNFDIIGGSND